MKNVAAVYLDDVLIYTYTINDGMKKLEGALKLLREEGSTLNLTKCNFLFESVAYLSYEITKGTVNPGERKVKAIHDFPTPINVRNIRQFIGLTGYFRHFVKNYADMARPLTQLLRKDEMNENWEWSERQDTAFRQLKRALVERPILGIYYPKLQTKVHTDASSHGIAGMLL